MDNKNTLATISNNLFNGINHLIENAQNRVAIFLNSETTLLYWSIGQYINTELKENDRLKYGAKILATLSQELTKKHGKGYTYTALTRMGKVAIAFKKENIATVSQQLSWSHLIELAAIENETKRLYYTIVSANQTWAVRKLRDEIDAMAFERSAIAKKPGNEIIAELKKALTTQKFGNSEFQQKAPLYYNLDVIISMGYRVKSVRSITKLAKRNTPQSGNLFQPNGNALGLRKQNIR